MKNLLRFAAVALMLGYAATIYTIPPEERMIASVIALGLAFGLVLLSRRARGERGNS